MYLLHNSLIRAVTLRLLAIASEYTGWHRNTAGRIYKLWVTWSTGREICLLFAGYTWHIITKLQFPQVAKCFNKISHTNCWTLPLPKNTKLCERSVDSTLLSSSVSILCINIDLLLEVWLSNHLACVCTLMKNVWFVGFNGTMLRTGQTAPNTTLTGKQRY